MERASSSTQRHTPQTGCRARCSPIDSAPSARPPAGRAAGGCEYQRPRPLPWPRGAPSKLYAGTLLHYLCVPRSTFIQHQQHQQVPAAAPSLAASASASSASSAVACIAPQLPGDGCMSSPLDPEACGSTMSEPAADASAWDRSDARSRQPPIVNTIRRIRQACTNCRCAETSDLSRVAAP